MSYESRSLFQFIKNFVTVNESSWELEEIADSLPADTEDAAGQFCDKYELGNWFYEALTLNDMDIEAELRVIIYQKRQEEHEAAEELAEIESDLRKMQGGAY